MWAGKGFAMNDVAKPSLDYDALQFHPLSEIFPLIEGDEFDAFVDTFRKQGLLQPIVLVPGSNLAHVGRLRISLTSRRPKMPTSS